MEQPLSSHRTARLSSACFRIHLRPQTPLNLRQVKETQTAKHANIENAPAFSPKISGCWQLAFGMQNPLTGSLPQDRWSSPLFLVFHPIPPLMHLFCFQREPFLFSVAQSVTDLDLNQVKSVARFDKYVNFILGAEDSTSKSDFQTMATLGSSFLELLQKTPS